MRCTGLFIAGLLALGALPAPGVAQQAAAAERWESTIQEFEAADGEAAPEPGGVVFVGSSSIRFWSTLAEDFPSIRTVNRGFGGSGMADAVHFADRIILPYAPRLVVVYTGENDLARGASADEVYEGYRELVQRIHEARPETRIDFISMKPSPSRWEIAETMKEGNEMIERFTEEDERLRYIDVWDAMLGPDGTPREELFVADMLHMNEAGYELWQSIVAPYVTE